jgi:hypothetical protein
MATGDIQRGEYRILAAIPSNSLFAERAGRSLKRSCRNDVQAHGTRENQKSQQTAIFKEMR